jgi:hypothetical protein
MKPDTLNGMRGRMFLHNFTGLILGTLLAIHDAELNNVYILLGPRVPVRFSPKQGKSGVYESVLVKIFLNFIPFQKLVFL